VTHAEQMLQTNPTSAAVDAYDLVQCIEACYDCAQSCTACADACLGEDDVCDATGKVLSRQTAFEPEMARAVLQACAKACRLCGDERGQHASHHGHCRVCAEACRRCEQACEYLLREL
jgi:hypothetical protein